jgi:hypothetical protein
MRAVMLLAVLAAIASPRPALADPQPPACQVTFARAPEDVQKVIESWVRAEPRCVTTLELRVIPTDGGYYLMARDADGRTHERLVPDAQSAGVLVASWMADDSVPPPIVEAPATPPPPAENVSNAPGATAAVAPPNAPPVALGAPTAVLKTAPARPGVGRWLTLGLLGGSRGGGLRGELDVVTRGRWSLSAVLAGSTWDVDLYSFTGYGLVEATDLRALATIARTITRGKWSLRLAGGAGLVHTSVSGYLNTESLHASGVFGTAEASALVARRLGNRWALTTGAVLTWYAQEYNVMSTDPFTEPDTTAQRSADVMYVLGVRRRM